MGKRTEIDYTVEKTVETIKILEVLEIAPASIEKIIERVGKIPNLNSKRKRANDGKLKPDAVRSILITLKLLGYANQDEKTKCWARSHKRV
jgi:hypothetical protein